LSTTAAKTQAGPKTPTAAQYRPRKLGNSFLLRQGFGWPGAKPEKTKTKQERKNEHKAQRSTGRKAMEDEVSQEDEQWRARYCSDECRAMKPETFERIGSVSM